jgi:hypothetical protein
MNNRFRVEQVENLWTVEDTDFETILGTFGLRESAEAFAALVNGGEVDPHWHRVKVLNRLDGRPSPVDAIKS